MLRKDPLPLLGLKRDSRENKTLVSTDANSNAAIQSIPAKPDGKCRVQFAWSHSETHAVLFCYPTDKQRCPPSICAYKKTEGQHPLGCLFRLWEMVPLSVRKSNKEKGVKFAKQP